MRSPLAYPLNRNADMDVGGASDLQTDVMRFMAILSLCLVAIFALVQSMPMAPSPTNASSENIESTPVEVEESPPVIVEETALVHPPPATPQPVREESVSLTRPKWIPAPRPAPMVAQTAIEIPAVETSAPPVEESEGFTLRFESDLALTRLVATNQVGLYAIENTRARRMSISESRVSFWDASMPGSFHEMEHSTVPAPVREALARSGADPAASNWGVTLPGSLRTQLETLMQEHRGGELVIGASGTIRRETPK